VTLRVLETHAQNHRLIVLPILLRIAGCRDKEGMSIWQLSEAEGLSSHYGAKLTRLLRIQGFINSTAGYKGGYILAKPAKKNKYQ